MQRDLIEHVLATSDPTLRAVFAEDSAALAGLVIAAAGLGAHQMTGSPVPDAVGSILVGVLLAVVAIVLINRNRRFLVGQEADPRVRAAAIQALLDAPEVARVTYLRLEEVKPPSQLPLEPAEPVPARPARRARRPAGVAPTIVESASGVANADRPEA